ncbi:MAG: TrbC family F-type conjugative pilus assembly protein, partial [Endozoicomonas sp.]
MNRHGGAILLLIFWSVLPVNALEADSSSIYLYVSASMGDTVVLQLLQEASSSDNVLLKVRGLPPTYPSLNQDIHSWRRALSEISDPVRIDIDPVAFQENGIDRVPALSLVVNGDTQLTAFGVTSTDWLKRQYKAGRRGNIGTYGTTYPVSEPDLLAVLMQHLQQQDWQQVQTKAQQQSHDKTLSYGVKLPTSRRSDTRTIPLSGRWHTPIIALNINDTQQQKAVIPWLQQHADAVVMVSGWSSQHVQKLPAIWHEHLMYLLPPELIHRFQITSLPVLLTPENPNHWRVTTQAVSSFSTLEVLAGLRTLIHKATQQAQALETIDNPSKALCQSVPILSEKLMTSVPWKELFPIRIGLAKLGSGKEPNDRAK